MLKSVTIHRYRSCIDLRLDDLTALTALVGRNGAGKTNILRAIEWLARQIVGTEPMREQFGLDSNEGSAVASFVLGGETYQYFIDRKIGHRVDPASGNLDGKVIFEEYLYIEVNGTTDVVFQRSGEDLQLPRQKREFSLSTSTSAVAGLLSLLRENEPLKRNLLAVAQFFSGIVYYPLELTEGRGGFIGDSIISADDYAKWISSANSTRLSTPESTSMRILRLYLESRENAFKELKSLMGESGLKLLVDIHINNIDIPINQVVTHTKDAGRDSQGVVKHYFLSFTPYGSEKRFTYSALSFGTKKILHLIVSMLVDRASVALIEQPEDGIHLGLLHKLPPLLRSYSIDHQFILTSHSSEVMNCLEPEEIRLIEMTNGISKARALTAKEISDAREYLADEGPLSDFLESL